MRCWLGLAVEESEDFQSIGLTNLTKNKGDLSRKISLFSSDLFTPNGIVFEVVQNSPSACGEGSSVGWRSPDVSLMIVGSKVIQR